MEVYESKIVSIDSTVLHSGHVFRLRDTARNPFSSREQWSPQHGTLIQN